MKGQELKRRLWRAGYALRFYVWQQRRLRRVTLEWVGNRPILVLPGVLNPVIFLASPVMLELLTPDLLTPGARCLDMGAGSGVGALRLAELGGQVTAVDINPAAARCTRLNALLNHLEASIEVLEGDLFAPVAGRRFDLILFNPPYYRGRPRNQQEQALFGGDVMPRFAAQAADYLTERGEVWLLLSSTGDTAGILGEMARAGFSAETIGQRDIGSEIITLYRFRSGC